MQFKGLSRVFSNTTVQKHQFFSAQLSLYELLVSMILCWFLPNISMNQPWVAYVPSSLNLPPTSPHPTPLGCHRPQFKFPESHSKFPWAVYFTHGSVHVSALLSACSPPSPAPTPVPSVILFSISVSPLLPLILPESFRFQEIRFLLVTHQVSSECIRDQGLKYTSTYCVQKNL